MAAVGSVAQASVLLVSCSACCALVAVGCSGVGDREQLVDFGQHLRAGHDDAGEAAAASLSVHLGGQRRGEGRAVLVEVQLGVGGEEDRDDRHAERDRQHV